MAWFKRKTEREKCKHYDVVDTFYDFHTGSSRNTHQRNESDWCLYFRAKHKCKSCGYTTHSATPVPVELAEFLNGLSSMKSIYTLPSEG